MTQPIVLGLDLAMLHTGYSAWQCGEDLVRPLETWVASGTLHEADTTAPTVDRIASMAAQVWGLLRTIRPHHVVLEGPLTNGHNRSTTGTATYAVTVLPLRQSALWRAVGLQPLDGTLRTVVQINPARLHRFLRGDLPKQPKPADNKRAYQRATNRCGRSSEHEVDAYWLAHYGWRFICSCLHATLPHQQLLPWEREAFLDSLGSGRRGEETYTGMLHQPQEAWWRPPGATDQPLSGPTPLGPTPLLSGSTTVVTGDSTGV